MGTLDPIGHHRSTGKIAGVEVSAASDAVNVGSVGRRRDRAIESFSFFLRESLGFFHETDTLSPLGRRVQKP